MERIAFELEVEARIAFSERMADARRAPHGLIVRLARDRISVARPVLERSSVLTDDDLIQIVRQESQDHLHAIAGRASLTRPVTAALVQNGDDRVLTRVTANAGAELSRDSLNEIAERARFSQGILDALAGRKEMPPDLMIKVKQIVATRMKAELASSSGNLTGDQLEALIEQTADGLNLATIQSADAELMEQRQRNALTEELLLKLVRQRKHPDVVRCLAMMSGLDESSISFCLTRAEVSTLGIICKALGFANSTYLALLDIRLAKTENAAITAARALRHYDSLSRTAAERAMRFLKVRKKVSTDAAG